MSGHAEVPSRWPKSAPNTTSRGRNGSENLQGTIVKFEAQDTEDKHCQMQPSSSVASKALVLPTPGQRKCRVPGCCIRDCNLGTHQKYRPRSWTAIRPRPKSEVEAHDALQLLLSYSPDTPLKDGVDGFPALPVQETLDVGTRSLFHHFFVDTFDKLALLFRGPSVANIQYFKERMLATALTSEPYCRALILQAQTDRERHNTEESESKVALNLYNNALKAFQQQLVAIREKPHPLQIELALLVICTLMMFDSTNNHPEAQKMHWQGLRELVSIRGGIHAVSTALAYVIHADRACAIRFEEVPTYANKVVHSLPMPMPRSRLFQHGFKFSTLERSLTVDSDVLNHLVDAGGLVELWEQSRMQPAPARSNGLVTSLDYLYYTRDRLDEQFALLNAQWAGVDSIERCLLWAARMVEYPVTWSNYVPTATRSQCQKLADALKEPTRLAELSRSNADVLRWMLFTMTVIEPGPEVYDWGIDRLRELLLERYGSPLQGRPWWAGEQENLFGFIWSSSHYTSGFQKVCTALQGIES